MKSINQIDKFIKETRVFDPDKYELLLRLYCFHLLRTSVDYLSQKITSLLNSLMVTN